MSLQSYEFASTAFQSEDDNAFIEYQPGDYLYYAHDNYLMKLPGNYAVYVIRQGSSYLYKIPEESAFHSRKDIIDEVSSLLPVMEGKYLKGAFTENKLYLNYWDKSYGDSYLAVNLETLEMKFYYSLDSLVSSEVTSELNWFKMNTESFEECECRALVIGEKNAIDELIVYLKNREAVEDFIRIEKPSEKYNLDENAILLFFDTKYPVDFCLFEGDNSLLKLCNELDISMRILEFNSTKRTKEYYRIEKGFIIDSITEDTSSDYNPDMDDLVPWEFEF